MTPRCSKKLIEAIPALSSERASSICSFVKVFIYKRMDEVSTICIVVKLLLLSRWCLNRRRRRVESHAVSDKMESIKHARLGKACRFQSRLVL